MLEDWMHRKTLADELAEVRLTLAQLKRRERQLEVLMDQDDALGAPVRPGWPIQRVSGAGNHPH
jgi:hypothetical protein